VVVRNGSHLFHVSYISSSFLHFPQKHLALSKIMPIFATEITIKLKQRYETIKILDDNHRGSAGDDSLQ
jgi:hypothetical protein